MNHIVLLGDSIFDNASYVPGKPAVIEQLRHRLPGNCEATLLAVDGDVTSDVIGQTDRLPKDTTHLVLSCGGNDALQHLEILYDPACSVAEVLERFTSIRADFQLDYHKMLNHVLNFCKCVTVCTVYDSIPGLEPIALTALSMFNEIILREAFMAKVPVIDLRLVCNESTDYSEISSIEPSAAGGEKIAQTIVKLIERHDFTKDQSVIYF